MFDLIGNITSKTYSFFIQFQWKHLMSKCLWRISKHLQTHFMLTSATSAVKHSPTHSLFLAEQVRFIAHIKQNHPVQMKMLLWQLLIILYQANIHKILSKYDKDWQPVVENVALQINEGRKKSHLKFCHDHFSLSSDLQCSDVYFLTQNFYFKHTNSKFPFQTYLIWVQPKNMCKSLILKVTELCQNL